jgi:hypothetical protein
LPGECTGGWQATEKPVFGSDVCADSWRTAEKSVTRGEYAPLRRTCSPLKFLGGTMKKTEAIKIITDCAREYQHGLANRNILFLFGDLSAVECFETTFLPRHFLHLTGVEPVPGRVRSSTDFYDRCRKSRLSPSDFEFAPNGTTDMKLTVLPQLMQIYHTANMIGDFDFTKSLLYTEKLAGNVSACMGFVRDGAFYIPNTTLREDIRDLTVRPQKRILATFQKTIREPEYARLCYIAKGVDLFRIKLPGELTGRIKLNP